MPEVLEIERASFEQPWTEEDVRGPLRPRHCIGMLAGAGAVRVAAVRRPGARARAAAGAAGAGAAARRREVAHVEEDFVGHLRQRNCIGMVAEHNQRIVGFMIYELHKARLQLLNFATGVDFRRLGVGLQMVDKLVDKLSQQRRQEILLEVRESNLQAQLFFKAQDFRAVRVLRTHYDDTTEDAYVMRYRLYETAADTIPFQPQNRIDFYNDAA